MTFDEIVRSRRSVRQYQDKPVDPADLRAVLEAGRLAPSARNLQGWHFTVAQDAALRQKLSQDCNGQASVAQAGAVLVVWNEENRIMACGQNAATVDCSIALTFMMLKATELGLGTCWLGAFDADAVKKTLDLPFGAVVIAVMPLGIPAEQPEAKPRKALGTVADIREAGR